MKLFKKEFARRTISAVLATAMVTGIIAGTGVTVKGAGSSLDSSLGNAENKTAGVKKLANYLDGVNGIDRNFIFDPSLVIGATNGLANSSIAGDSDAFYSDAGELDADQMKRNSNADRGTPTNPFLVVDVVPNELSAIMFMSINGTHLYDLNNSGWRIRYGGVDIGDSSQFEQAMSPSTTGVVYHQIRDARTLYFLDKYEAESVTKILNDRGNNTTLELLSDVVMEPGNLDASDSKFHITIDGIDYEADDSSVYLDAYGNEYTSDLTGMKEFVTFTESGGVYTATSGNFKGKDVTDKVYMDAGSPVVYLLSRWDSTPKYFDTNQSWGFQKKADVASNADYADSKEYILLNYDVNASNKNEIYVNHKFTVSKTEEQYGYYYQVRTGKVKEISFPDGVTRLCVVDKDDNVIEVSTDGKYYDNKFEEVPAATVTDDGLNYYIWVGYDYYDTYNTSGSLILGDDVNDEIFFAACLAGIKSYYTYYDAGVKTGIKQYAIKKSPLYKVNIDNQIQGYYAFHQTDYFKKYCVGTAYGGFTTKKDDNGNEVYQIDADGNYITDEYGNKVLDTYKDRTSWSVSNTAKLEEVVKKIDKYHLNAIVTTPEDLNCNLSLINATNLILFNDWTTSRNVPTSLAPYINKDTVGYDTSIKKTTAYKNAVTGLTTFTTNDLSWKAVKLILERHYLDALPLQVSQQQLYQGATDTPVSPASEIVVDGKGATDWNNAGINNSKATYLNYDKLVTILTSMDADTFRALWWNRLGEAISTESIMYKDGTVRYNTTGTLDTRTDSQIANGEAAATGVIDKFGYNHLIPFYLLDVKNYTKAEFNAAVAALINKYGITVMSQAFEQGSIASSIPTELKITDARNHPTRVFDYVYLTAFDVDTSTGMRTADSASRTNGTYAECYDWFADQGDNYDADGIRSSSRTKDLARETIFYYLINASGDRARYNNAIKTLNILEIEAADEYYDETFWNLWLATNFGSYIDDSATVKISRVNINELENWTVDDYVKYDMIYIGGKSSTAYKKNDHDLTKDGLAAIAEYARYRSVIISADLLEIPASAYTSAANKVAGTNNIDGRKVSYGHEGAKLENSKYLLKLYTDAVSNTSLSVESEVKYDGKVVNVFNDITIAGSAQVYSQYTSFLDTFLDKKTFRMSGVKATYESDSHTITLTVYGKPGLTNSALSLTTAGTVKYYPVLYIDKNYDGYFDKNTENSAVGANTPVEASYNGSDTQARSVSVAKGIKKLAGCINWMVEIRRDSDEGPVVDSWQGVTAKNDKDMGINVLEITSSVDGGSLKHGIENSAVTGLNASIFTPASMGISGDVDYYVAPANIVADGTVNLVDYDVVVLGLGNGSFTMTSATETALVKEIKDFMAGGTVVFGQAATSISGMAKYVGVSGSVKGTNSADQIMNAYATNDLILGGSKSYAVNHSFQATHSNITEWPYAIGDTAVISAKANAIPATEVITDDPNCVFSPYYTLNSSYNENTAKGTYTVNDSAANYYAYAYDYTEADDTEEDFGSVYVSYYTGIVSGATDTEAQIFANMLISAYVRSLVGLDLEIENVNKTKVDDEVYLSYVVDAGNPSDVKVITNATDVTTTFTNDVYQNASGDYYKRVYFTLSNISEDNGRFIVNFYDNSPATAKDGVLNSSNYFKVFSDDTTDADVTALGAAKQTSYRIYRVLSSQNKDAARSVTYNTSATYEGYECLADTTYCVDVKLNGVTGVPYIGIVGFYVPFASIDADDNIDYSSLKVENTKNYVFKNVYVNSNSLFNLD